ncbi:MAG: TonB-dependent receptor [Tidjanibacter sp.]|nr:TonB-dependent receptor [Tidjanibacter sp.]
MKKFSAVLLFLLLLSAATSHGQTRTVSGHIMNARSHESLIGATTFDNISSRGTVTNEYGFYSLTLPKGNVELECSYVGFSPKTISFTLKADTVVNILLDEQIVVEEVIVYGNRRYTGALSEQMSAIEIPVSQIKSTPTLFGENDVLKAIQLLPGVQAGSEGSAGIYVRGGGQDENLLLLDGVPVYNVNHMFGFFSVFNADAIKNVTLFKGSFPARFGSRLSSVIDVRTNDGDMFSYHGNVSVGLISSKINLEGPIWKGHTSFNISARRTYADALAVPAMSIISKKESNDSSKTYGGYYFYDLNAKINHKFSDRDRLYLSFYIGDDEIYAKIRSNWSSNNDGEGNITNEQTHVKLDWNWGNIITSLRWNHVISPRLFMDASATFTRYRHNLSVGTESSTTTNQALSNSQTLTLGANSGIYDYTAKVDFDWSISPENTMRFGASYVNHTFVPDISTMRASYSDQIENPETGQPQDTVVVQSFTMGNNRIHADETTLYVEEDLSVGDFLKANIGLNYSTFTVRKKFYHSLQPRLSVRALLAENLSLKAGYAYMTQYIHLLSNNSISLPTDLWVPVTDRIKPMTSQQYSAGVFYDIRGLFDLSVEGYYKTMDNLLEYKDGASLMATTSGWEDKVSMGRGWSYGVEFLLQRSVGRLTGWIGYTWSKSLRRFDRAGQVINGGKPFYAKYDRRHDLSITAAYKISDRIDMGATWIFNTGNCATLALQKYQSLDGGQVDYVASRNNYRYDPYHRLDLGINFHKQKKHGVRTWNISVYNAYNHMNPFFVYQDTETTTTVENTPQGIVINNSSRRVLKKTTIFPIIPSISYSYKF